MAEQRALLGEGVLDQGRVKEVAIALHVIAEAIG